MLPFTTTRAQPNFVPDRPGLGDGSYILQPKITYLESGFEYFEGGAVDQFSLGQVLFRHGLVPGVEMRVQVNSFIIETRPLDNETGVPDPGLGLKFDLLDQQDSCFQLSGMGSVSVPAGYSPFTDDRWHPSAKLIADYDLTEGCCWTFNSNLGYTLGPGETSITTITFTPGFAIPETNYGGYFGYAGFLKEQNSEHFVEAGLTRMVDHALQLDINTGYDLNNGNSFVGLGLAVRF
ncbi:transporter [Aliifodinibius sp. S!AR15-10]|nr:transporter [Aliifodinibius sp. S!AR15-10]